MKPYLARLDSTLSLDVRLPDQCLIPLLFKIDHLVRSSFHLEPNTGITHKQMFRQYWKKLIDQEEDQTELASMEAVSAFANDFEKIHVRTDSREGAAPDMLLRDSMVGESLSEESDITVLPEEVCVVSIGSEDSDRAKLRKERAIKRKRDLVEQQKAYMAFMTQFYPHDAHVKTHREFVEEQKRRMKAIYKIQRFVRHHKKMRLL